MFVFWLEQKQDQVQDSDGWLNESEIVRLRSLRFPKRRADWRLGRWTAKIAVATTLGWPLQELVLRQIEIRCRPSGAPEAWIHGSGTLLSISLSHRNGIAMCSVAPSDVRVGCDLELIEPRSQTFVTDYFTVDEQSWIQSRQSVEQPAVVTLLWSAKESGLKALREGLRLDPRSVAISLDERAPDLEGWSPLAARYRNERVFTGWWSSENQMVRTLITDCHAQPSRLLVNPLGRKDDMECLLLNKPPHVAFNGNRVRPNVC